MTTQEAPGRLELVRAFVNTLDLESGDEPSSPDARELAAGPRAPARGAVPARISPAPAVREAFRALLANNGVSVRKEAALTLSRAARGRTWVCASGRAAARGSSRGRGRRRRARPAAGDRRRARSPTAPGTGSRPAGRRSAAGPSTTTPETARATGARWPCAATAQGARVPRAARPLTTRRRAAVRPARGDPRHRRRRDVHGCRPPRRRASCARPRCRLRVRRRSR